MQSADESQPSPSLHWYDAPPGWPQSTPVSESFCSPSECVDFSHKSVSGLQTLETQSLSILHA